MALDQLWAPDWVFSSPRGQVISRDGFLELFETGAIGYDSIADLRAEPRVYGDAAVMLGTVRIWYTAPDGPHEEHLRYTAVYARPNGPWQMEAWQSTLIEGGALYEPPFTDLHSGGPDELFAGKTEVIDGIFERLRTFEEGLEETA